MKKVFGCIAMALALAACNKNEMNVLPGHEDAITITARLAPKGEITKAVAEGVDEITVSWAVDEHIAILYNKDGNRKADARITAVDGSGAATIEFAVVGGTPNNTACTLVYPLSAAKDDNSGVKDAATLLAAQNGTLNANLDVRVGAGTIQTATPGLTVTTQPAALFAIFKFTLDGAGIDATHPLVIKQGNNTVVTTVTPTSSTSSVYVAMPAAASSDYRFIVNTDNNKFIKSGTATIAAGKYYQTTLTLNSPRYPLAPGSATVDDLRSVIGQNGNIYLNAGAATAAGTTAVAKICYVGSNNCEDAPYNHGLALAMSDANNGNTCKWNTSNTDAGHTKQGNSTFTEESGLQYNVTHNTDEYPAFKAAIANNGAAAPTGCSAWFLASGFQLGRMITAAGGYASLRDAAGLLSASYWTSSEFNTYSAWHNIFGNGSWSRNDKDTDRYVRSCLAF